MMVIRKKHVLQELAICLFLMLEFFPETPVPTAAIQRAQKRSRAALDTASTYTGIIGEKDLQAFIEEKPLHFVIDCGSDIVRGDTIRFIEQVYDSRRKPPRTLGNRGVIAEVMGISKVRGSPMLHMRVISSGGVWSLSSGVEIYRTLKIVTRTEVMRIPWEDEAQRNRGFVIIEKPAVQIKTTTAQVLGRYDVLKSMQTR